jgi:hypothetical protein
LKTKTEELRQPWRDWAKYDDVGHVMELGATYDDALKKNSRFLIYSVKLANRICEDLNLKCKVTWGKWGGRLDQDEPENAIYSQAQIEAIADKIIQHRSWKALMESTWVFTYGRSSEDEVSTEKPEAKE